MNIKQSTLAAAVTAALAMGVAGQAAASAYAGSELVITDLTILITEDGTNPSANAEITSFQFTATNTATLNGASAIIGTGGTGGGAGQLSQTCGGTPGAPSGATNNCNEPAPRVDPGAANAPGGDAAALLANNTFIFSGPGALTYSHSDSVISTAELTGDPTTNTQQMAESEVQSTGDGNANAELTSSTGFTFNFTISGDAANELILGFSADPFLQVALFDPDFLNGNALANITASFTLTNNTDGNSVSWSPQGDANNSCVSDTVLISCAEDFDGVDLNRNLSVSADGSNLSFNPGAGLFGITLSGLYNGNWTLGFNTVTSTSVRLVTQQVPEPGMLALLGIGLAGLGAVARRRNKLA